MPECPLPDSLKMAPLTRGALSRPLPAMSPDGQIPLRVGTVDGMDAPS